MHVQNTLQTHCSWTRLAAISTFTIFLCLLLMYNKDYYLARQSSTILISKYSNSDSVPFSTTTESMLNVTLQSFNSVSDTQGFLVKSPKCQIPDFDPFDESIKKFLKPAKPIICSTETPLTYVTTVNDNISMLTYKLVINATVLNSMSKDKLQCCVSVVTRFTIPPDRKIDRSVDNLYNVSRCKNFEEEITLANSTEFILVKCYDKSSPNKDVYTNMHSVIPLKENVQKKIENTDGGEKLSVLLLGIDSMSRLNMLRTMPKTVSLLRKKGWTELRSHLRVEDNTLPNILGVFTGYTLNEITNKKICAPKTLKSDDCPLIWKNFSDHGYVTIYAEDQSFIGTFNYEKVGFVKQPTDYYLRPYIIAAEKLIPTKKHLRGHCLGYQSMTDHVYHYLSKFLDVFKTHPFFAHVWLNNFSHNDHNVPAVMDERYVQFFTDLHDNVIINNTLIIFFGDHGIRFGEIRETYVGWLETNMPFIYIWVPEWFRKKYPEAYHNLQANSRRLTSHFDLYMTLRSVLNRSYMNTSDGTTDVSTTCKSCVSLFDSLIGDRSCEDIGVNSEFCACSQYKDVSVNDAHVHAAVLHTVSYINLKLKNGTRDIENKTKCANINLLQKMSAKKKINPSKKALSYEEFLIVFKTTPGEAIFETTVRYLESNNMETIGVIERINSYGNQSHCVHDSELKLYCFCTV